MKDLMLKTTTQRSHLYNQSQLKLMCDKLCDRIDDLLEYFHIDYKHTNNSMITMKCPIHGGDNPTAVNIYHEGSNYRGNWKCRTHQCEKVFKESILGFIKGLLSHKKYRWTQEGDKAASFYETLVFVKQFIGNDLEDLQVDFQMEDKKSFTRIIEKMKSDDQEEKPLLTKDIVKANLQIPAQYYIDRGYSEAILVKYDIGLCYKTNKEMSNRVVAPIYDINGEYVVGCSGRSIFDKCKKCKYHHNTDESCPGIYELYKYSKWKHSSGFKSQNHLYNLWYAKEHIKQTHMAIIVESPGNVWRLEENNIHNSVAIFGSSMSDRQKLLLDSSGAMKLVILTDNDDAGRKAADNIKEKCEKTYQIYIPQISKNDIGDMNEEEIKTQIKDYIESIV